MYNLLHYNDPLAIRIEPLLCKEFLSIEPCKISSYSSHPFGDSTPFSLESYVLNNLELFKNSEIFNERPDGSKDICKSILKSKLMFLFDNP